MSYGVGYSTPFVEGQHDVRDKLWDEQDHIFRANNQMQWFLKEVSRGQWCRRAHC